MFDGSNFVFLFFIFIIFYFFFFTTKQFFFNVLNVDYFFKG